MLTPKMLELSGLVLDLIGLFLLLSPDIPLFRPVLRLFPTVRRMNSVVEDVEAQCREAGFTRHPQFSIVMRDQSLRTLKADDARKLIRLYPKSPDQPTSFEGLTLTLIREIPIENRGAVRHDPFIAISDKEKARILTSPLRLSDLFQQKEEFVRRLAYTRGFMLMALATSLLVIATIVR